MNKFVCSSRKKPKCHHPWAFRFYFFIRSSNVHAFHLDPAVERCKSASFHSPSLSLFLDFLESSLPCTVASRLLSYFLSPWWLPTTSCSPSNIPFRTRGRHEAATRERKREKDGWSRFESALIHVFFFCFPSIRTFNSMRDQFRRSYLIDH